MNQSSISSTHQTLMFNFQRCLLCRVQSPGVAVKLCLGDLLVMGSNPETEVVPW